MTQGTFLSRRNFLALGASAALCAAAPSAAFARSLRPSREPRVLDFHNLHTGEKITAAYWRSGAYDRRELQKIYHILRDFRSGDIHPIDIRLFDLLHDLQGNLKNHNRIEIVSGYRSPKTNSMLARFSHGVAKRSMHMEGKAIDLRISGSSLTKIRDTAIGLRRGGVGYYPDSEFVHVDVGNVRRW